MSEDIRLQKFLSQAGVCSRRQAEKLILAKRVKINDQTVEELGIKVNPDKDIIKVDNKVIEPEENVYFLLNKPKGYVSTKADRYAEKTIFDLIPNSDGLHNVGRLDKETEGLILLTNDGNLTQKLTHPSYEVEKTYQALVKGKVTDTALNELRNGVFIETDQGRVKTLPAKVDLINKGKRTSTLELTIREGRKRQVRLMCQAVGFPVIELKRIKEGILNLKGLKVGQYRTLSPEEVNSLKND